jgi:hypothetical protein
MFFLSCGALTRPFSLVFVKTLPKEERPSRKRKKEEYNKKRRERSGEFVKGRSSIYRKILRYYSTVHLQFYPHFTISPTHTITPTLTPTHTITPTLIPTHYYFTYYYYFTYPLLLLQLPFTITLFNNYHYLITTLHNTIL